MAYIQSFLTFVFTVAFCWFLTSVAMVSSVLSQLVLLVTLILLVYVSY